MLPRPKTLTAINRAVEYELHGDACRRVTADHRNALRTAAMSSSWVTPMHARLTHEHSDHSARLNHRRHDIGEVHLARAVPGDELGHRVASSSNTEGRKPHMFIETHWSADNARVVASTSNRRPSAPGTTAPSRIATSALVRSTSTNARETGRVPVNVRATRNPTIACSLAGARRGSGR